MIPFVTWKWQSRNRDFASHHVNVLRNMLERHYGGELICITDDPEGLDPRIEVVPMPVTGLEDVQNPQQLIHRHKKFPSCYRRLWLFSDEARMLGDRIVSIDIDVIIVDDITELVETEGSFVGWCDPKFGWNKVAGGIFMLDTGAHTEVWKDFDPYMSPEIASEEGYKGSDQAWMAYKLFPPENSWSNGDGLIKINWTRKHQRTAPDARIVFTNGHRPPWQLQVKKDYPWINHHWH